MPLSQKDTLEKFFELSEEVNCPILLLFKTSCVSEEVDLPLSKYAVIFENGSYRRKIETIYKFEDTEGIEMLRFSALPGVGTLKMLCKELKKRYGYEIIFDRFKS